VLWSLWLPHVRLWRRSRKRPVEAGDATVVEFLPVDRVVRYAGQPIATVAGPTRALSQATVRSVEVRNAPLTAVVSTNDAQAPGAPTVHSTPRGARGSTPVR
jgi:xanthine dehydrogenase YagR molybdenum-binding subunit